MFESPRSRAAGLAGLAILLVGLLVWTGTLQPDPSAGAYADQDWYAEDPTRFLGDRVTGTGRVVGTDPVRVSMEYNAGARATFVLDGVDHAVAEGLRVRVFGVLTGERRIAVLESFTTPPNGLLYAYGVSLLAGLWTLSRIARHWRIDLDCWGLTPGEGRND